ncbi:hypothetical protein GCM10009528_31490 [Kineococcus aurantiacus]
MHASAVLAAWERAAGTAGHERALALLDPADADPDRPLGARDADLLVVLRDVRGPDLDALATCPACGTTLEVHLPVDDLRAGYVGPGPAGALAGGGALVTVAIGAVVVRVRPPATADLLAVSHLPTVAAARAALLARCVLDVTPAGAVLTDDVVAEVGRRLEESDPLVDVRVRVVCAECGHAWAALLDVPELVWAQVSGVGRRLLREVDVLARRYGWSEGDILALSEERRRAYLDLP